MNDPDNLIIKDSHPSLAGHFPGRPVVPGVVLLAELQPALTRRLGAEPVITAVSAAKFMRPLLPGQAFSLSLDIDGDKAKFSFMHEGQCIANGTIRFSLPTGGTA